MKKISALLIASCLAIGGLALAGCGDPCTKAVDKSIECLAKDSAELKKKLSEKKDEQIKDCKKDEAAQKKAKECIKHDDCAAFTACMEGKKDKGSTK